MLKKIIKAGVLVGSMIMVVGCMSAGAIVKNEVSNNKIEGVIYGVHFTGGGIHPSSNITDICKAISNSDVRCENPSDYSAMPILSRVGNSDGAVGNIAIVKNGSIEINKPCSFATSSSCAFYKVKVEIGKLPTIIEVASKNGDGKCKWSGFNGLGGTVCETYGWNYRDDKVSTVMSPM